MAPYPLVVGGLVADLQPEAFTVPAGAAWGPDVSGMTPVPRVGWAAAQSDGAWTFSAPAVPAPGLAQQAQAAVMAGLTVTSASAPALDGTYACDPQSQSHFQAEMIALQYSGGTAFADGTATVAWPDVRGAVHTFAPAQFTAFALAVGAYVAALFKCMNGTATALPPATATIA